MAAQSIPTPACALEVAASPLALKASEIASSVRLSWIPNGSPRKLVTVIVPTTIIRANIPYNTYFKLHSWTESPPP
jgi:hypothetical protein